METISWQGKQVSQFTVVGDLWQQYIGGNREPQSGDYLQRLHMLQESIRKTMRLEHESYLNGKATAGRVAETKGHAILLGKIIANWQRWLDENNKEGKGDSKYQAFSDWYANRAPVSSPDWKPPR